MAIEWQHFFSNLIRSSEHIILHNDQQANRAFNNPKYYPWLRFASKLFNSQKHNFSANLSQGSLLEIHEKLEKNQGNVRNLDKHYSIMQQKLRKICVEQNMRDRPLKNQMKENSGRSFKILEKVLHFQLLFNSFHEVQCNKHDYSIWKSGFPLLRQKNYILLWHVGSVEKTNR